MVTAGCSWFSLINIDELIYIDQLLMIKWYNWSIGDYINLLFIDDRFIYYWWKIDHFDIYKYKYSPPNYKNRPKSWKNRLLTDHFLTKKQTFYRLFETKKQTKIAFWRAFYGTISCKWHIRSARRPKFVSKLFSHSKNRFLDTLRGKVQKSTFKCFLNFTYRNIPYNIIRSSTMLSSLSPVSI